MIVNPDRLLTDREYREEMRFRFETDHFYAAEVLGFDKFNREIHGPAVSLYFPKNRKLSIPEQHHIKQRLHLDPRLTFKTTLGRVDDMQWIAAFPSIVTILEESATQPLASEIGKSLALFCWTESRARGRLFRQLYPELAFDGKEPGGKWNTPTHRIESLDIDSTVDFTSPNSQQSGWHPWVLNPDDMVDTRNSGIHASDDVRKGVISTYRTNKNTLQAGGYINVRGTRYHPFDLYGDILTTMDPARWKVLIRSALAVKDGARLMPGEFPREEDIVLNFPMIESLRYAELREKFYDEYESFMCQMMNDPQGGSVPVFDERKYSASLAEEDHLPLIGETVMVLRPPYQGKKFMATHAECAIGRIAGGKVYILDAWRGVYVPSGLCEKAIRSYRAWECEALLMEDLPGTDQLPILIRNEALKKNRSIRIGRLPYEEDDSVRNARIAQAEPVMAAGRLVLSRNVTAAAEMRKQFIHFGLTGDNGIVDCISRLLQRIPLSVMRAQLTEEEVELQLRKRENAQWNAIFQQRGMPVVDERARQRAQATVVALERTNEFGLPALPGGLDG